MEMFQYILFFVLILYTLQKKTIVEGIERNCCGILSTELIDLTCSELEVPSAIKRCFPPSKNSFDCDKCDGICKYIDDDETKSGECVPTSEGGYCLIDGEMRIFKNNEDLEPISSSETSGDLINEDPRAMNKYREENAYKCSPFNVTKPSSTDNEDDSDFDEFEQEFGSDTEVDQGGSALSFVSEGTFDFINFENIVKLISLLFIIGLISLFIWKGNILYRLKMLKMKFI